MKMISAIVLTKNEEKSIEPCLRSLKFCDEIVVIDDNSKDKTVEIAKKARTKIFVRALNSNFSKQRNYGMSKAKGEWILFIDADEIVHPSLGMEIIQLINNPLNKCNGFFIRRKDYMFGKELKHGETGGIKLLRLAKKSSGEWQGIVHEQWRIKGETGELINPIIHYPHPSISEFLKEINFYTDLRAKELCDQRANIFLISIILYPIGKFILNYFIKLGLLDGISGLIIAIMMSFHSFLVRAKAWIYVHHR